MCIANKTFFFIDEQYFTINNESPNTKVQIRVIWSKKSIELVSQEISEIQKYDLKFPSSCADPNIIMEKVEIEIFDIKTNKNYKCPTITVGQNVDPSRLYLNVKVKLKKNLILKTCVVEKVEGKNYINAASHFLFCINLNFHTLFIFGTVLISNKVKYFRLCHLLV